MISYCMKASFFQFNPVFGKKNDNLIVGGRATMVVRGEVMPVLPLARLLGWPQKNYPQYGVLMQSAESSFILAIDMICTTYGDMGIFP